MLANACLPARHGSKSTYFYMQPDGFAHDVRKCMFTLLLRCRVEFLTHDISVHVPHHVASKIPWYNLRMANDSLRQNWGQVSRTPAPLHLSFFTVVDVQS